VRSDLCACRLASPRGSSPAGCTGPGKDILRLLRLETMKTPTSSQELNRDAAAALRRMREVVGDYHATLLEIATQTRGKGATLAREAVERWSGGGGK
ncbi:MAG: hypothetical protein AAF488_04620, partial [Planctomycetota bacterium]